MTTYWDPTIIFTQNTNAEGGYTCHGETTSRTLCPHQLGSWREEKITQILTWLSQRNIVIEGLGSSEATLLRCLARFRLCQDTPSPHLTASHELELGAISAQIHGYIGSRRDILIMIATSDVLGQTSLFRDDDETPQTIAFHRLRMAREELEIRRRGRAARVREPSSIESHPQEKLDYYANTQLPGLFAEIESEDRIRDGRRRRNKLLRLAQTGRYLPRRQRRRKIKTLRYRGNARSLMPQPEEVGYVIETGREAIEDAIIDALELDLDRAARQKARFPSGWNALYEDDDPLSANPTGGIDTIVAARELPCIASNDIHASRYQRLCEIQLAYGESVQEFRRRLEGRSISIPPVPMGGEIQELSQLFQQIAVIRESGRFRVEVRMEILRQQFERARELDRREEEIDSIEAEFGVVTREYEVWMRGNSQTASAEEMETRNREVEERIRGMRERVALLDEQARRMEDCLPDELLADFGSEFPYDSDYSDMEMYDY